MPFGPYKDFADCVSKNKDKDNPEGYCAAIHKKVTGDWPSEKKYRKKSNLRIIADSIRKLFDIKHIER